jgi:hypothetical protein
MLLKALTWATLGCTILFAILAITTVAAWNSLGDSATMLAWLGVLPTLVVTILLAVAVLVIGSFQSGD